MKFIFIFLFLLLSFTYEVTAQSTPVPDWTKPTGPASKPVQNWSKPVELSKPVKNWTKPVDSMSRPVNNWSKPVDSLSRPVQNWSKPVESMSSPVQDWSSPVDLSYPVLLSTPVNLSTPISMTNGPIQLSTPVMLSSTVSMTNGPVQMSSPIDLGAPIGLSDPVDLSTPVNITNGSNVATSTQVQGTSQINNNLSNERLKINHNGKEYYLDVVTTRSSVTVWARTHPSMCTVSDFVMTTINSAPFPEKQMSLCQIKKKIDNIELIIGASSVGLSGACLAVSAATGGAAIPACALIWGFTANYGWRMAISSAISWIVDKVSGSKFDPFLSVSIQGQLTGVISPGDIVKMLIDYHCNK